MPHPTPLPPELTASFSVSEARDLGVSPDRLRGRDLLRPFHGVRMRTAAEDSAPNTFDARLRRELALIRALARRLTPDQFLSHRSAALLWGVPLPHARSPELHVSSPTPARAPRIDGTIGHRVEPSRCPVEHRSGIPVSSAAATWAMLGALRLGVPELVAAGDYFVRMYREGYGRPDAGRPPLSTRAELEAALALGRWRGQPRLRRAAELVREDSWSPQESLIRVELVLAGLPEPELNVDVFDEHGRFLGCLDLAYPEYRVGSEYQGLQHGQQYDADVERMAAFRAAQWDIIEVTRATRRNPGVVVRRVAEALRRAGWQG